MPTTALKLTFDAVYYHVTDMEKSIAFYRDVLGFPLKSRVMSPASILTACSSNSSLIPPDRR